MRPLTSKGALYRFMVRNPVRRYTKKYQYITYYHKIVYLNRSTMYLNQTQMAHNTYHITITSPIRQPNIIFSTQTPTVPPISKFLGNKHTHILCILYGIPITIHFFHHSACPKDVQKLHANRTHTINNAIGNIAFINTSPNLILIIRLSYRYTHTIK